MLGGEFDERLKGFVVWLPTMPGDSLELARREAATFEKFSVSHAWDPERRLGDLYAKLLNLGSVAWDVYFLYAPGVKWEGVEPPQPTFWMHQLPPEVGVDEDLYLNPTRMFREILKMLGGEVLPSRSDLGLMLHGKGLFNVTRERTQYNLSDIRQAFDDSKVQSDPAPSKDSTTRLRSSKDEPMASETWTTSSLTSTSSMRTWALDLPIYRKNLQRFSLIPQKNHICSSSAGVRPLSRQPWKLTSWGLV